MYSFAALNEQNTAYKVLYETYCENKLNDVKQRTLQLTLQVRFILLNNNISNS